MSKTNSPSLFVIMGLPGSGKTYFAKAFAEKLGGLHINSDMVRKEMYRFPAYTNLDKTSVYQAMFHKTCQALKAGKIVIIDATFSKHKYRQPYFDFVKKEGIPIHLILMEAKEQTIAKRVLKKRPDSDADFTVYQKIKAEFEPLEYDHLIIKSDQNPLKELINKVLSTLIKNRKP